MTKVEFSVDGVLRAVDATAAYRRVWQAPNNFSKATHTVYARAYDAQGLTATSATVTVRYSKSAPSASASSRRCGSLKRRVARKRCAAKRQRAARAR